MNIAGPKEKGDSKKDADHSLFGLGPPATKEGDVVCVLYGCSVPVILWKSSDGHMIQIGEAYVNGKMEGEAKEDLENGQKWSIHEEDFKLK